MLETATHGSKHCSDKLKNERDGPKETTMIRHALLILLFAVCLPAQVALAHETDTSEILQELRELREDLEAYVIPAAVEGLWRETDTPTCSGNFPGWVQQILDDAGYSDQFRMKQSGNHLVQEITSTAAGREYGAGIIQGEHLHSITSLTFEYNRSPIIYASIVNGTVLSSTRISYVSHLQFITNSGVFTKSCTGEWRRIGD